VTDCDCTAPNSVVGTSDSQPTCVCSPDAYEDSGNCVLCDAPLANLGFESGLDDWIVVERAAGAVSPVCEQGSTDCHVRISAEGTSPSAGLAGVYRTDAVINNCGDVDVSVQLKFKWKFEAVGSADDVMIVDVSEIKTSIKRGLFRVSVSTATPASNDWQEEVLDLGIFPAGTTLQLVLAVAVQNAVADDTPSVGYVDAFEVVRTPVVP